MAALVLIGIATTLIATEPEKSAAAEAAHARKTSCCAVVEAAVGAFSEFLSRDMAFVALAFVVLFKFTDALSGDDDRAVRDRSRLLAQRIRRHHQGRRAGRDADRRLCRRLRGARLFAAGEPVARRRCCRRSANLAFSWQAIVGLNAAWLTFAIVAENFTSAIGTVIFVAYLSALCRNPLHTATQYALLTALAAVGRTYLSVGRRLSSPPQRAGRGFLPSARLPDCRRSPCWHGCSSAATSTRSRRPTLPQKLNPAET